MAPAPSIDRELFREQVRAATDLARLVADSGVTLKPAGGGRMKACCPFHNEKTPSFFVNEGSYHCFGCGEHGDCFSFIMKRDGLTFPEAIEALANRAGIPIPQAFSRSAGGGDGAPRDTRQRLLAANEFARDAFYKTLRDEKSPLAAAAREYLAGRSLSSTACADWGIGLTPDSYDFLSTLPGHPPIRDLQEAGLLGTTDSGRTYDRFRARVMFPIRDPNGKTIAFSGRILPQADDGKTGKYVNSPETPIFKKSDVLFGLDRARETIRTTGVALLCEGQIDTIRLHLGGFTNAVAPQGTAFTPDQARVLKRYATSVVLVLDGDGAGHKAALRDAGLLLEAELPPTIALLPAGEDPDTYLLKNGPDAFRALLDGAISPVAFLLSAFPVDTLPGVTAAKNALFELLAHIQSEAVLDYALREAAGILHLSHAALAAEMDRHRAAARRAEILAQNRRDEALAAAADSAAAALRDNPAGPAVAASPAVQRPRRPGAPVPPPAAPAYVVELARLLCVPPGPCPATVALLQQYIRYDLIAPPAYATLVAAFLEAPDRWRAEIRAAEPAAEPDLAESLADRLIVEPGPPPPPTPEEQLRLATDLLARLWLAHLRRRRSTLPPADRLRLDADLRLLRHSPPNLTVLLPYLDA